jgi:hypothetical protein
MRGTHCYLEISLAKLDMIDNDRQHTQQSVSQCLSRHARQSRAHALCSLGGEQRHMDKPAQYILIL